MTERKREVSPKEIVSSGLCIGCGVCTALDPTAPAMRWDKYGQLEPDLSGVPEAADPQFALVCPFSPDAPEEDGLAASLFPEAPERHGLIGRFEAAYVGHAEEGSYRAHGSSGGMATWVAAELLRLGMVDGIAHVAANDAPGEPHFSYRISRRHEDVCHGAKSRYYPVHLADVLRELREVPGRYALVGIPCFIRGVQQLRIQDPVLRDRIAFTLGLFCGHMKSTRFVSSFAWQLGADPAAVRAVEYRLKDPRRPANWYTAHLTMNDGRGLSRDWWHLADGDWGAGFFQNSACNYCDDVVAETADVAFGDAWLEPYSKDGHGTNVVIVRRPELNAIIAAAIEQGRLALTRVDAEFVAASQAAGFRQRREGLAYRLTWRRAGIRPRTRVAPSAAGLSPRRKLLYRARVSISAWSHTVGRLAAILNAPKLYITWARAVLAGYQALAYSRGRLGTLVDAAERIGGRLTRTPHP
jgi:coenzyme F420-reducing hydrogenase beta subunit